MNATIIKSMKRLYEKGAKTKEEFAERVEKDILTKDEYKIITGEDYAE